MAGDMAMNGSGLAGLPSEILGEIIRCLLDDISANKRSGHPHSYYTPDYKRATAQSTKALTTLCLVSRRLREAATLQLYRHVTLVPRSIPGSETAFQIAPTASQAAPTAFPIAPTAFPIAPTAFQIAPTASPAAPTATQAAPHDGVLPLTLFLRTLVERVDLQPLVHSLDCQFFLRRVESTAASRGSSSTIQRYVEASEFYKQFRKNTTRIPLNKEDLILLRVSSTADNYITDTSERVLAAILSLVPELQTLSLAPLPCARWLPIANTNDAEELLARQYECHYHTLASLLELLRQDEAIAPGMLEKIRTIRFTALPSFKPFSIQEGGFFQPEDDPTLRIWPSYSFPLSSCLELLLGSNITEFEADALDEFSPGAFQLRNLPMHSSIKRACLTTSFPTSALDNIGHNWNLTALSVRPPQIPTYTDDDWGGPAANLELWDKSFLNMKSSLKELDIGYVEGYELPSSKLTSLPLLESLEHLCIGIPLLANTPKLSESPLNSLLPPNLKTLRLHDWVTGDYYDTYLPGFDHFELAEDEAEDGLKPLIKFQMAFSTSLRSFAQICGITHPHMRSVMLFGFRPVDRAAFYSSMNKDEFYTAAREFELDGPEPGQVVRGGREIQALFAQTGVVFEELFHAQEVHFPFRAQVNRYQ
ncbi:unnamed protein product [Clonostachys rosea]|uniref:F-box domain-containing protein n=1 Tax=Bionectria ochroleuca TaxID=29856 RepID=A0ABY6U768_BIOOC|nr:unnamed protein product [Clonostachys rosea]